MAKKPDNLRCRDGVWYVDIRVNGKRYVKSTKETHRDRAKVFLRDFIASKQIEIARGGDTVVGWDRFVSDFLSYRRATKAAPRNIDRDRHGFEKVAKLLPVKTANEITVTFMRGLNSRMKAKGTGDAGRMRVLRGLKTALYWAQANYKNFPASGEHNLHLFKYDKVARERVDWYRMDQQVQLLTGSHGQWLTVGLLGIKAGLRPAEIYHAHRDSIDWERMVYKVQEVPCGCPDCDRKSNAKGLRRSVWTPKNARAVREIPLDPQLAEHLKGLGSSSPFLVSEETIRPANTYSMGSYYAKLNRKVALEGWLYKLRHTFASNLVNAGRSLAEIAPLMGHSTTRMTELYAHIAEDKAPETMAAMPVIEFKGLKGVVVGSA